MGWLLQWWRQADQYEWMCGYLQRHGTMSAVRVMFTIATLGMPALGPWYLLTSGGLTPAIATVVAGVNFSVGLAAALMWATRIPTRTQSLMFIGALQLVTAINTLPQKDPVISTIGCFEFAVMAAYIGFFHAPRYTIYSFLLTITVTTIATVRVALEGSPALALCAFWMILALNILTPVITQFAVHNLGIDASDAENDPLTGLLNRRGFTAACDALLTGRRATDTYVAVVTVDLDNFKTLNDTLGHAQGDRALMAVAATLRANTRETAILARTGGDEFVIIDAMDPHRLSLLSERLCKAIHALPYPITASVGSAGQSLDRLSAEPLMALNDLLKSADSAMYIAKHSGGNQVQHAKTRTPSPSD